jgi:hypothetical protein
MGDLNTYHIFSNTPRTFFPKNCDQKLGCAAYSRIIKLVKTCLHQDEWGRGGGSQTSIRALVRMRLNTSDGQCPIETFTFPPTRQAKPANRSVNVR